MNLLSKLYDIGGTAAGKIAKFKVDPLQWWEDVSKALGLYNGEYNVFDYGATGDGTTNDTAAVQAGIDACAAAGGGEVYFPPGNYLLDPLTVPGPISLVGAGWGRVTNSADNAGLGVTTLICSPACDANSDFIHFRPDDPDDIIIGGGVRGFDIDAVNATGGPRYVTRLTGVQYGRFEEVNIDGVGGTTTSCWLLEPRQSVVAPTATKGCFWNVFDRIVCATGGTANCITLDGESGSQACTQNVFKRVTLVHGGYGILFNGNVDNNRFHDTHIILGNTDGAGGYLRAGVQMVDGVDSDPRNNTFRGLNGHVNIAGTECRGNLFMFDTSETSSFTQVAGGKANHYEVVSNVRRDRYSTFVYPMQREIDVPATGFSAVNGDGSEVLGAHGGWAAGEGGPPAWLLAPAVDGVISTFVVPPKDLSNGTVVGVRVHWSAPAADNGLLVPLRTQVFSIVGTNGMAYPGAIDDDQTVEVASADATGSAVQTHEVTMSVAHTRGHYLGLIVSRMDATSLPATPALGTIKILGAQILFESEGPKGGTETWSVPVNYDY